VESYAREMARARDFVAAVVEVDGNDCMVWSPIDCSFQLGWQNSGFPGANMARRSGFA